VATGGLLLLLRDGCLGWASGSQGNAHQSGTAAEICRALHAETAGKVSHDGEWCLLPKILVRGEGLEGWDPGATLWLCPEGQGVISIAGRLR
jgi:hypothetical protein